MSYVYKLDTAFRLLHSAQNQEFLDCGIFSNSENTLKGFSAECSIIIITIDAASNSLEVSAHALHACIYIATQFINMMFSHIYTMCRFN